MGSEGFSDGEMGVLCAELFKVLEKSRDLASSKLVWVETIRGGANDEDLGLLMVRAQQVKNFGAEVIFARVTEDGQFAGDVWQTTVMEIAHDLDNQLEKADDSDDDDCTNSKTMLESFANVFRKIGLGLTSKNKNLRFDIDGDGNVVLKFNVPMVDFYVFAMNAVLRRLTSKEANQLILGMMLDLMFLSLPDEERLAKRSSYVVNLGRHGSWLHHLTGEEATKQPSDNHPAAASSSSSSMQNSDDEHENNDGIVLTQGSSSVSQSQDARLMTQASQDSLLERSQQSTVSTSPSKKRRRIPRPKKRAAPSSFKKVTHVDSDDSDF